MQPQESGFYYLQSRYYDPSIGRFINADSRFSEALDNGINLFAYCENNPIMKCDPSGTSSWYLNGVYYTYGDTAEDRYRKEANLPPVSYLKACNAQFVHCSPSYYENTNTSSTTVGGVGMSVSAGWGLDVGASGYYVEDGEFQATISTLGIGGGLGASTGFGIITHSDIEHVWDLGGWGVAIGGTLGLISYEYNYGTGGGFGIISPGTEMGLEFHALITFTVVEGVWGH